MKHQVLEICLPFISFMHEFEFFLKGHNILALILDPRYKSMWLVMTYLGCETIIAPIANYDEQLLLPLPLEVYKVFMANRIECVNESALLWIFKMCLNRPTQMQRPTKAL